MVHSLYTYTKHTYQSPTSLYSARAVVKPVFSTPSPSQGPSSSGGALVPVNPKNIETRCVRVGCSSDGRDGWVGSIDSIDRFESFCGEVGRLGGVGR